MQAMKLRLMTSTNIESDEELLLRIGRQDKAALQELYQRYRQPLGSFLNRKIYANKLVDEAFNDVMFTVWQKANGFRGDSKASTWIFGIAYRVALSTARKETKHTRNRTDGDPSDYEEVEETHNDTSEVNESLASAINKLKDKHKEVIELAYFHDKSLDEIANIIGIPLNTVKTRLFHARQYLKKEMRPTGDNEERQNA